MTNQKRAAYIIKTIILVFILSSLPNMYTMFVNLTEKGEFVVNSKGTVTNIDVVSYPCGKNQSSTCKQYEITIDGKRSIVNEQTYLTTTVGQELALGNYQQSERLGFLSFFHALVSFIILLFNVAYILVSFIGWALTESNRKSFKFFLKGLY